ncbi:hypothetical protein HPCPY1124_0854 [Helicobacter pylori CPY1124]|nr:hypothetical protein HPCPY1124_0854 [Helicobacter pylori CPY1124]
MNYRTDFKMEIVFLKPISENLVCEVNNSNKFIQKNII